nr:Gag-Pol polyprotein [Tanacetum cinerariifolium]
MKAGSKDHPPMLAPGWKYKPVPDSDGNLTTTTERVFETYKNVKQDIRDQLNAEAEAVQIIDTGLDNDIYSTVDACPNANAGYESQRIGNVAEARETVRSSMVQKSRIQCYNCKEFRHVSRECQKPKWGKDAAYHREKMLLCKQEKARIQLNAEQTDWKDDTDDESDDQELEAHYMYMAKVQEVSPDAVDSRPIFDTEPEQKVNESSRKGQNRIKTRQKKEAVEKSPVKDADLSKERELLASLIEKLKCEIDESKNRSKFLETSNKSTGITFQGYVLAATCNYNHGNPGYRPQCVANQMRPSEEDECVEETYTDPDHEEYNIKVPPPPPVQKPKPPIQRNFVIQTRDSVPSRILYPSRMLKQKQQEKDDIQIQKFWNMFKQLHLNITLAEALVLMQKYQKMLKALFSNKEKL